jgi:uncharacterized protein (DUF488 family)
MSPDSASRLVVFSIGHSTRSFDEFVSLLVTHGVRQVVDIRTIPKSRRHPQFERDALAAALPGRGIEYRHLPGLGGLRHPRRDSPNTGWRNESFRGYADYMGTPTFERALDDLIALARTQPTAMMCAEAVWWRCHRGLVADALVVRDVEVRHIVSAAAPAEHQLNPMARVVDGRLVYPSLL